MTDDRPAKIDPHSHTELPPESAPERSHLAATEPVVVAFVAAHPDVDVADMMAIVNAVSADTLAAYTRGWADAKAAMAELIPKALRGDDDG